MKQWLAVLVCASMMVGCRSEEQQVRDVVLNYLQADLVHGAHQRAYTYLSSLDKVAMPPMTYVESRGSNQRLPDAKFAIDTIDTKGDRHVVAVTTTAEPNAPKVETTFVVLEDFDGKHRVYIGLKEIEEIRAKLADARRLGDEGGLERAKEILEQVKASPFRGSQPELYDEEVAAADRAINRKVSRKSLDKRMGEALKMSASELEVEIAALDGIVPKDDPEMLGSLKKLKTELAVRKKQSALEHFLFTKQRVRNLLNNSRAIAPFVSFQARNNTKRPLSALKIEIRLVNEKGGTALDRVQFDLIAPGKVMEPQAVIPFERELKTKPVDWRGRDVEIVATDLVFADVK